MPETSSAALSNNEPRRLTLLLLHYSSVGHRKCSRCCCTTQALKYPVLFCFLPWYTYSTWCRKLSENIFRSSKKKKKKKECPQHIYIWEHWHLLCHPCQSQIQQELNLKTISLAESRCKWQQMQLKVGV